MIIRLLLLRSLWLAVGVVLLLTLIAMAPLGSGRVPEWKAGEIVAGADLVAVVTGPSYTDVYPWVSVPELFAREGEAPIYTFVVAETIFGDASEGEKLVIIKPPGFREHHSADLTKGRSLLFLRRIETETVERIRNRMPWGAERLPEEIWGFVEQEYGWMSWVQLLTEKDGAEVVDLRSPIVSQLKLHVGVERTEQGIKSYVKNLFELRRDIQENGRPPDIEFFDRYQKLVIQQTIDERLRSDDKNN